MNDMTHGIDGGFSYRARRHAPLLAMACIVFGLALVIGAGVFALAVTII
jgi:hypothetical protein